MSLTDRRVLVPAVLGLAVLAAVTTLADVLAPVAVAALLAVLLNPLVDLAARCRLPRALAVALLYLALVVLVVGSASGVSGQFQALARALEGEEFVGDLNADGLVGGPGVAGEFVDLDGDGRWDGGALTALRLTLDEARQQLPSSVWGDTLDDLARGLLDLVDRLGSPARDVFDSGLDSAARRAGGLLPLLTLALLIPFYLFMFLVEYPALRRRLGELVPPRHRPLVERVGRAIARELATFLRGRLACGLVKALLLWVGLLVLGVPFAAPIALASGVLSLVPVLGVVVGAVPASVLALTMPGGGSESLLSVLALFAVAEAFEGAVLYPFVLGRETGLHPVVLVLVLLAGGSLLGTLGVLVALPVALVVKVLWLELLAEPYAAWARDGG